MKNKFYLCLIFFGLSFVASAQQKHSFQLQQIYSSLSSMGYQLKYSESDAEVLFCLYNNFEFSLEFNANNSIVTLSAIPFYADSSTAERTLKACNGVNMLGTYSKAIAFFRDKIEIDIQATIPYVSIDYFKSIINEVRIELSQAAELFEALYTNNNIH